MLPTSQCSDCKFYNKLLKGYIPSCLAFPRGIPDDILFSENLHNKIIDGQVGSYIYTENVKRQKAPSAKSKKKNAVIK